MKEKTKKAIHKCLSLLLAAAMLLNVTGIPVWANEITPDETEEQGVDLQATGTSGVSPANPVHHCTKQDDGTDTTDWSYIYFGSYPQSEVTGNALTTAIIGASYDSNGDAWVGGTKYRRISKGNTNNTYNFGDSDFRYFKWERIKWRVLQNDGNTLFVVADKGLDSKCYNEANISITWENCTLRKWLNNDFYGTAFNSQEQGSIVEQIVVNEDDPYYGTEKGANTRDKVFLLSIGEITNPEYGFCEDGITYSVSRQMQSSDYLLSKRNCWWLSRSLGYHIGDGGGVIDCHYDYIDGNYNYSDHYAVVPALHIKLSSNLWFLTDDGSSGEGGNGGTGNVADSYGVTEKQTTRADNVYHEATNYTKAVNDFYSTVTGKFKTDYQKVNSSSSNFKQLRSYDETAADRKTNQLLTIEETAPTEAIDDAYEVLYDFLKQCMQTGIDEKLIKLDDIDTSQSAVVIESKIINKVYDAVKEGSETIKGTGTNGFTVELKKLGIFGQAFGNVTISGGKGKVRGTYKGMFCSDGKVVSAVMNQFVEELSDEVRELYKEAALSLWKDFMSKSQLSSISEEMLRSYLEDKADYLIQKGYGKLLTSFLNMKKGCELINTITSAKTPAAALKQIQSGDMKALYQSITKLSYTDKELTNETIKTAMEKVETTRKNFESALYDYLYNEDTYSSLNAGEKAQYFWKSIFQCPVDIEVYDETGKLIGSVSDGTVNYDESIYIELNGDVKTVYIPQNMKVSYKLTGTDDGIMNYVLEEYQEGVAVGRLNYYSVPLSEGIQYNQSIEAAELSDNVSAIPLVQGNGESINADEYISAENKEANVTIEGVIDGSGVILGAGKYAKGDSAELTAISDEGYRFEGWYEEDVLVNYNPTYRFTALTDKTITARFTKIPVEMANYSIELSEKYQDDARVVLYDKGKDYAEIVISLYTSTSAEDFGMTIKKYDKNSNIISSENVSAVCDGGFRYTISDLSLDGWRTLELLDLSGNRIALIGKTMHVINAIAGENGLITPYGEVDVVDGADQIFTMKPNKGYEVKDVLVDGISIGATTSYTFENVTGTHTIVVTFKQEETRNPAVPGMDPQTSSNTNAKTPLAKAVIILSANTYSYNGKAKKPTVKSVKLGNKTLSSETDYTVSYTNNKNIGTATVTVTGKGNYTDTAKKTFKITAKKGSIFTVGAYKYKITGSSAVAFTGLKSSKTKKVTIQKTVKIGGKSFKVTSVAASALKGKKVTSVTIGSNVTTIGKNTFTNCKKLSKITIKSTKLKTVGKNAFKDVKATAKIKVPAKKLSKYKKLLKGKGQGMRVTITK